MLDQDFSTTPPGSWLLRQVPWSEASHRIRALNAGAALAEQLALREGDACLEIVRRTRTAEGWVTGALSPIHICRCRRATPFTSWWPSPPLHKDNAQ